jgi:threonine dehydrogenase-like Zn-dependent dehydrogenase
VVLAVGEGVEGLRPGDRVASRSPHRQLATVNASRALKIPDAVSDEEATWFGLACIVQNGVRRAEHELGDAVVVVGLGILGQLVTQYTRLLGAREVVAIDTAPARLAMAAAHGATHVLELPVGETKPEVERLTDGRGADVVYDVTGHAAVLSAALPLARRFGKLLLLGDTGSPSEQRLTSDVVTRGVRIIGAHDGNPPATATDHAWWTHANMARLFFTYLERGQMRVSDLVTHRFRPEDAPAAYDLLTRDRASAMGVVFEW